MALRNFLLVIHILGAIIGFGPALVLPVFMGPMMQRPGAAPHLMAVFDAMDRKLMRFIDVIQALSGGGLIIVSQNLWNPFVKQNRWLFASILLYIVLMLIIYVIMRPRMMAAKGIIEREGFTAEAQAAMAPMMKVGPLNTAIVLTIVVLMIVKPGSGTIHY